MSRDVAVTSIAKEFHWEMGHRLPFHGGGCRNIHGHSYRMWVEITGALDEHGMVMDYFDMKSMIDPMVEAIDHAFLCDQSDAEMLAFFQEHPLKHVVVPFPTTAENIAHWFADRLVVMLDDAPHIGSLRVRVSETLSSYAEVTRDMER